jgi:hypothetical protein
MHPLLLSIANIDAGVHMKATSHAFSLAAYLPIPKFTDVDPDMQATLAARVYHHCLDWIFANLKAAESSGALMSDPGGRLRMMHTPLVAWIADRPEQLMIAAVSGRNSAISLATTKQFDDPLPHPLWTRQHTLNAINRVLQQYPDPWNLRAFMKACEREGLNGVHEPFWRDYGSADPSLFLVPDALHQWHKFFYDHCLKWIINIITSPELDFRFKALQPQVGVKHWHKGISRLKQCTGHEHREIETQLVAVAAGAVSQDVLSAVRALVDFIFQAQNLTHSDETFHALREALQEFHHYKQSIITSGGQYGKRGPINHFCIPKLETFQHVTQSIQVLGSAYQWTSDITERCHITHAKTPYRRSNHIDFHKQCCRFLDHDEKRRSFNLYLLLKDNNASLQNEMRRESSFMASQHPEATWIAQVLPSDMHISSSRLITRPAIQKNLFTKRTSMLSDSDSTALYVNNLPHLQNITVDNAARKFHLPDLRGALGDFFSSRSYLDRQGRRFSSSSCPLPFERLNIWYNFKIQCRSTQDSTIVCPPCTVQALPPDEKLPYGRCNAVLALEESGGSHLGSTYPRGMFWTRCVLGL